jgi:hypothetical protein
MYFSIIHRLHIIESIAKRSGFYGEAVQPWFIGTIRNQLKECGAGKEVE